MSRSLAMTAVAAGLALAGCSGLRPVQGRPSSRPGWTVYELSALRFEAPAAWRASGGERRISLEAPDGRAKLDLSVPEAGFADERACLSAAQEKLRTQQATLERARLHPSRLGGRPAESLEADRDGWHLWALAACDGGRQYRVFFTATTPAPPEVLEVWRSLLQSARIGGEV